MIYSNQNYPIKTQTGTFNNSHSHYHRPILMNLELTDRCPLKCPQCYCHLNKGNDMPLDVALEWIDKSYKEGVEVINLSGGETLCYPYLYEVIKASSGKFEEVNVALSGVLFNLEVYSKLISSGVTGIFISLNGSTNEINSLSRDGFSLAIDALKLLQNEKFPNVYLNWVMHSTNSDDFENIIKIAEEYNVHSIAVMLFKPNSKHELPTVPTLNQINKVAKTIKSYSGSVKIEVESCFSSMRALLGQNVFFNSNIGISKGCGAGRDAFSVSLDGFLTPCRHLDYKEKWESLADYWEKSEFLKLLRSSDKVPSNPCNECKFCKYCRPCVAVTDKLFGTLQKGDTTCALQTLKLNSYVEAKTQNF